MKNILQTNFQLSTLLLIGFFASGTVMGQTPIVTAYGQHYGGQVVYHYQLINNSPYAIKALWIGYDTLNDNNRDNNVWELKEYPSGTIDRSIPPASVTTPQGWEAMRISQEETPGHVIVWGVGEGNTPRLQPGQTLSGMSIKLDRTDDNYVKGHANIHYSNLPMTEFITVPLQRLDTTPPTLSIALSPNILRTTEKHVPITATITVSDDYDLAPEIKLESITANESPGHEGIKDAQFGTDDRQFLLKADRRLKAGRIYTVTYSATDGSGNKTMASATVTVPHDQGDKEREGKGKGDGKKEEHERGKSDSSEGRSSENKPFWKFW